MPQSEFYTLTKRGFSESLELVGIPITYGSTTRSCINTPIDHVLFSTPAGFVTDITMQVEMLDDDVADFTGLDNLSLVTVDGAVMQVHSIKTDPVSPIVQLALKKDK